MIQLLPLFLSTTENSTIYDDYTTASPLKCKQLFACVILTMQATRHRKTPLYQKIYANRMKYRACSYFSQAGTHVAHSLAQITTFRCPPEADSEQRETQHDQNKQTTGSWCSRRQRFSSRNSRFRGSRTFLTLKNAPLPRMTVTGTKVSAAVTACSTAL
jgi:hypothetical protein